MWSIHNLANWRICSSITFLLFFGIKSIKDAWDPPPDAVKSDDNSNVKLDELSEVKEVVKEKVGIIYI